MAFHDIYEKQVELLVRTLPHVAKEGCFALKGGTAINLFIRNLPRLSIDIDLTYLPAAGRNQALAEINDALKRIAANIGSMDGSIHITESAPNTQGTINKLIIRTKDQVQIKIELSPVMRVCVYSPVTMQIVEKAEDIFGFVEINVLSFADLYAGKIMAALDRQHPRDLFDVHLLLTNEGIGGDLRTAIIVYLISHDHSPHSLLSPVLQDIAPEYKQNFIGMTREDVPLDVLINARQSLIDDVVRNMPNAQKEFLTSFYRREPKWDLLEVDDIRALPAVRWRELNLDKAGQDTRNELVSKLESVFE